MLLSSNSKFKGKKCMTRVFLALGVFIDPSGTVLRDFSKYVGESFTIEVKIVAVLEGLL